MSLSTIKPLPFTRGALLPASHALFAAALVLLTPLATAEDITFQFAPQTGKTYRIETTRHQTTDFRGAKSEDEFSFHTSERYEPAEDGYRLHQKIVTNRMARNGSEIQSPMNMLLSEVDIAFHIDKQGEVTKVEGFEKIPELFKERFPAPVFSAFAPMINIRSLENQQVDRWKQRHRPFIGKSAPLGGHLFTADLLTLPRGGSIVVYSVYTLAERTEYQGRDALRVKLDFDSDPKALAKRTQTAADQVQAPASEFESTGKGQISGDGTILIGDASLEVFSVETTKTVETAVAIPGQDEPAPYRNTETYVLSRAPNAVSAKP